MGAAVDKALKQLVAALTAEITAGQRVEAMARHKPVPAPPKKAVKVAVKTPAPGYKNLSAKDKIKKGDEWKLAEGWKRSGGKRNEWRKVGDSIGRKVGDFTKSVFRRKV